MGRRWLGLPRHNCYSVQETDIPPPPSKTGVPTLTESSISTRGDAPLGAMKQPSSPRVTTVPWIRVQGLEVLLLVTKTIMESTTYVVGTGSPSMARAWGGRVETPSPLGRGWLGPLGLMAPTHGGGQVSIQAAVPLL